MKLYVRFGDQASTGLSYSYTGIVEPTTYRMVEIEFTEEQIDQLVKRKITEAGGIGVYETREVIALTD
jgi:hypothetical protein